MQEFFWNRESRLLLAKFLGELKKPNDKNLLSVGGEEAWRENDTQVR